MVHKASLKTKKPGNFRWFKIVFHFAKILVLNLLNNSLSSKKQDEKFNPVTLYHLNFSANLLNSISIIKQRNACMRTMSFGN